MDGVGFQSVNNSSEAAGLLPDAPVSAPVAPTKAGPAFAIVRDYLTTPRSTLDLSKQLGLTGRATRKWIDAQLCRRTIVRTAYGQYGRADCFATAPAEQIVRTRPVYDKLLAYLVEPRRAFDIARHIDSTIPIATGHMCRMARQGVVVRIAYGFYVRTDKCEAAPKPEDLRRGRMTRDALVAAIGQGASLEDIAKEVSAPLWKLRHDLAALVRDGVIECVEDDHYRPVPKGMFS